jgi:SAM-dependent methyltransferase
MSGLVITSTANYNIALKKMSSRKYDPIVLHYEKCLKTHGDTHLGVDWPNYQDSILRYKIMLGIATYSRKSMHSGFSVTDLGCGAGHLLEYIKKYSPNVRYTGIDISEKFIGLCKSKFPEESFLCCDLLETQTDLPNSDFVIMNGLFTEKLSLTHDEMWDYFQMLTTKAYQISTVGIAFNVMSKLVDWERADLFHVDFNLLTSWLRNSLTPHFIIRHDYGLYEYTVYAYKQSQEK